MGTYQRFNIFDTTQLHCCLLNRYTTIGNEKHRRNLRGLRGYGISGVTPIGQGWAYARGHRGLGGSKSDPKIQLELFSPEIT